VLGPKLIAVHELFDRIAREAESYSDLITERNAGLGAGQSRSRPSKLSLPLSPAGSPTKANTCSRSPRRLPHSRNRPAKLSDDLRRSATLIRPISSSRYPEASPIGSASSNRKLAPRYDRNGRLRKDPAGNPDDSTKIATAPIAAQYRCYWVGS
jgi:hypothetical protein